MLENHESKHLGIHKRDIPRVRESGLIETDASCHYLASSVTRFGSMMQQQESNPSMPRESEAETGCHTQRSNTHHCQTALRGHECR